MTPTWPIKQFYWEIVDIWGLIFIMTNDKCNSGSTSSEQEAMMHWNLFINRSSGQVQTGQVHPSSDGTSSNYKLLVGPERGIKCICEAKLCQNIWERQKKRSKAPVVLGQRASSSLRIPCFTATLQGDRLYNVKWVHLDPNPDPVIREPAAGQNPLLEMHLSCKQKRPRWWEEGRWRGYQQAMCPPFHSPPPPRKKPMYVCVSVCDVHVWINARTCTLTRLLPAFCRLCSHDQVSRISSAARPGKPKSRPNTIKHSDRSFIPEGARL